MNSKNLFSLIVAVFGEILIISCFLHFGKNTAPEILTVNITVASIAYFLLFFDFIFPWVNLKDKSQKQIGSIGLRWVFVFFYLVSVIGTFIFFNLIFPVSFFNLVLIHALLLFMLMIGLLLAFSSSDKVNEVYEEQKQNRARIDEMKRELKELQIKLDNLKNVPDEIITRINELNDNLRYLSPSNNDEALFLENKFVTEVRTLSSCFSDSTLNLELILKNIKNCERIFKERKNVFSN
jgi:hypothetical protein